MIYEYLIEKLALEILEVRDYKSRSIRTPHQQQLLGALKLNKDPEARKRIKQQFLATLKHPTELVFDKEGRVSRVPTALTHGFAGIAETYLSKYSHPTAKEKQGGTIDPVTGDEKSGSTWSAVTSANDDLTKLNVLKKRVKKTGKPHKVTFTGQRGNQLEPETHTPFEHELEVRMHMGEPHVFHKGKRVTLRATGNGLHLLAPGRKNDRIIAHTGSLSSPYFVPVATPEAIKAGRSVEQTTQQQANRRTRVAQQIAKRRKLNSGIEQQAAAVAGKARKLTPKPAEPPELKPPASKDSSRLSAALAFANRKG